MRGKHFWRSCLVASLVLVIALVLIHTTGSPVSAQGVRIRYGETGNGEIANDSRDVWLFDGIAGDIVQIGVARTDGDLVPSVSLEGPDGSVVMTMEWPSEGSPTALFSVTLYSGGTHALVVSGQRGTSGAYSVQLTLLSPGLGASAAEGVIAYGQTVSGEISNTTYRQVWAFRGAQGDIVDVLMTATSGTLDPVVSLISPEENLLGTSQQGASEQDAALFVVRLPSDGVYTIVTRRVGENSGELGTTEGSYRLALTLRRSSREELPAMSTRLALGETMRGRLDADIPTALYSLEAPGGVLSIGLDLVGGSAQVAAVAVMTPSQALLDSFHGIAPLRSSVLITEPATVWIEVSTVGGLAQGPLDFELEIEQLAIATVPSRPLSYGMPQYAPSEVVPAGESGWHFVGQSGEVVAIHLQPLESVLGGVLRVYDPAGTLLVERTTGGEASQLPLVLSADGIYEVFADASLAQTGYIIEVERVGFSGLTFDQHPRPEWRGVIAADVGRTVAGELVPGSADAWVLDITEPQSWAFRFSQIGAAAPLGLAVERPDGTWQAVTVVDQLSNVEHLRTALSSAGRYRVIVFDPTGNTSSTYTLESIPTENMGLVPDISAKGVLSNSETGNVWTLDVLPDALLSIEVQKLSPGADPAIHVVGPDGLLMFSTFYTASPDSLRLTGIPTGSGGLLRIVVDRQGEESRLVYWITARVVSTADTVTLNTSAGGLSSEVFVSMKTPAPEITSVSIPEIVTPGIQLDAATLRAARPLDTEILGRGEIARDMTKEVWAFTANRDQVVSIAVIGLDGDSAGPDITVLDQAGSILVERYERAASSNYLTHRFMEGGSFYAVVGLDQPGRYVIWMDVPTSIDETIPDVISGQAIAYGETVKGELLAQEDVVRYIFLGQAGDELFIRAACTGGDLLPHLKLLDATGDILAESGEGAQRITTLDGVRLSGEALYQIEVSHQQSEDARSGEFALHLNVLRRTITGIQSGSVLQTQAIGGLATLSTRQQWIFDASAGEAVSIGVEPLTPNIPVPLTLQIADTGGHVFLEKQSRLGRGVLLFSDILLPRSGVYRVFVLGGQVRSGSYRITLDRNSHRVSDHDGAVAYGSTVGKVLTRENSLDVWTFAGSQGDVVALSMRSVRGDSAFVSIQLRAPNGDVLATALEDQTAYGARIQDVTLPVSGFYSVVVGNLDESFEGELAYELTVRLQDTTARSMGTVLTYGETVTGTFYADDPVDTWLFEGFQGDVITATILSERALLLPSLSLVSTDWRTVVLSGQVETLASIQVIDEQPVQISRFVLPASGTYAFVVQDITLTGGPYQLELSGEHAKLGAVISHPLTPGQVQNGTLTADSVGDVWHFEGVRGSSVTIAVTSDSRSFLAPVLQLIGPDGQPVAHMNGLIGRDATLADYVLPVSGTYTAMVSRALDERGRTEGRYTIELQQLASAENTLPAAIEYGQTRRGVLDAETPIERFSFQGRYGDIVRIRAEATSGNLDPVLKLYGPDHTLLAFGDDEQGLNATISLPMPADGTYEFEIGRYRGFGGVTEGDYMLLVERTYQYQALSPERLLLYGDRVVGTTDSVEPTDVWPFAGGQGDVIRVRVQFAEDDSPLSVGLQDAAGNPLVIAVRDQGDAVIEAFELPASGYYSIAISRPGDTRARFSPYSLDFDLVSAEAASSFRQGGPFAVGQPVWGRFDHQPGTHIWMFQADAGRSVSLLLNLQSCKPANAGLLLVGPDRHPLFSGEVDSTLDSSLFSGSITLPLDGLYMVIVSGSGDILGAGYRLAVQSTEAQDYLETVLTADYDGRGVISDASPRQYWSFEGQVGQAVTLRAVPLAGNLAPALVLWGPNGRPLIEGVSEQTLTETQAVISNYVLPETGTYRVAVARTDSSDLDGSAGEYRLVLRWQWISAQAAAARDVIFGEVVADVVQAASPREYAFRGLAGDILAISVVADADFPVPEMTLETETGKSLTVPVIQSEQEVIIPAFVLPENDRYVVVLSSEKTSQYTFMVDRRDQPTPSTSRVRPLVAGQDLVDGLETPEQRTHWTFEASAGDVLEFTVDTSDSRLRADVALYGPGGYITGVTESLQSHVTTLGPVRIPESGSYTLLVGAWLGRLEGAGGYQVRMEAAPPDVSGSTGGHISVRNVVVTGGITSEDSEDLWTFDGSANEVLTIRVQQAAGSGSLTLSLLAPDGEPLGVGEAGAAYQGVQITSVVLPRNGIYTLQIKGGAIEQSGVEYRLTVIEEQSPVLSSMSRAQGIQYGKPETGALQADNGFQAWVFFGQAGERISGHVELTGAASVSAVYVLDPQGHIVMAQSNLVSLSQVTVPPMVLSTTGFYGLVFKTDISGASGETNYLVRVDRLVAEGIVLGVLSEDQGEARGVLTSTAPVHEWEFVPAVTGSYHVRVESSVPGVTFEALLLSSDDTVLAVSVLDVYQVAHAAARLSAGERYTVVVSGGLLARPGSYRLVVVPDSMIREPIPLALDESDVGRIDRDNRSDEWQVDLLGGQKIALEVTAYSGALLPAVSVYDQLGGVVAQATASTDKTVRLEVEAAADSRYSILVTGVGEIGSNITGSYSIVLTAVQ